jgi:hypothetical protein
LRQNFSTSRASGLGRGVLAAALGMVSALDSGWIAVRASTGGGDERQCDQQHS